MRTNDARRARRIVFSLRHTHTIQRNDGRRSCDLFFSSSLLLFFFFSSSSLLLLFFFSSSLLLLLLLENEYVSYTEMEKRMHTLHEQLIRTDEVAKLDVKAQLTNFSIVLERMRKMVEIAPSAGELHAMREQQEAKLKSLKMCVPAPPAACTLCPVIHIYIFYSALFCSVI